MMQGFRSRLSACVVALSVLLTTGNMAWAGEEIVQRPEKLALDKRGIKVWTFQTANNPAFSYKAATIIDSNLSSVVALILDTGYLSQWVPYVGEVDVLDRDDKAGTFTLRMQMDFPFPLQDRDVVIKGKISQSADGTVTIKNQIVNDSRAPVRPKIIRITRYEGDWTIKPLAANKVLVSTTGFADPSGSIPLSVANRFVQQQPYEMLRNMKEQVKRYQNATVSMVVDPFTKK